MERGRKYAIYGLVLVGGALFTLGAYAKIWEYFQPKEKISNAVVLSIKPYYSTNDVHWSSTGNRLSVDKDQRPIDFPKKKWDPEVEEGDSVDLVVRRSFPVFGLKDEELDGLSIEKSK